MRLDAVLRRAPSKTVIFWLLILTLLSSNILYSYYNYSKLKEFDYASLDAKLISSKELRGKDGAVYFSLLFRSPQMDFRTYSNRSMKNYEGAGFEVTVSVKELSFLDMLRPPRLKPLGVEPNGKTNSLQSCFREFIASQHESEKAKEVYLNLFLNSEVSPEVESFINGYGLGAFFAISGLNVALLVGFIFLILSPTVRVFQDRYFPFANRDFWILLFSFLLLSVYAYLTDFTPSFIRAVAAAMILFFFALRGENLLSYKTLLLTTVVCLAIFPSFLFSIAFWLSFYGVFLIYLFLENNPFKNKTLTYIALSSWLFVAMLPIIHLIFSVFTKAHLLNSAFSVVFDIFYPLSLTAHIFGVGWVFDGWIERAIESSKGLERGHFLTPVWFFVIYIAVSFVAALKKGWFVVFNILAVGYLIGALGFISL